VPLPKVQIGPSKNKVEKGVLFFGRRKVSDNLPRLPRIPPQNHHKNTTSAHLFSSKTPAKTPIHHSKKSGAQFAF
jgi:hypothetical protein